MDPMTSFCIITDVVTCIVFELVVFVVSVQGRPWSCSLAIQVEAKSCRQKECSRRVHFGFYRSTLNFHLDPFDPCHMRHVPSSPRPACPLDEKR